MIFNSESWLLLLGIGLLFIGGLANLFSLAAVKNAAKADVNRPHKAYVRHTNYLQHAADASLNFLTILLILSLSHFQYPLLASHIQAVPIAVVVWVHILRSISRTAILVGPFACFTLTSVYRNVMVGMAYASTFLVALYTIIFNFMITYDILHDYQDKMVWMSWMMTVQGLILPGAILLVSNLIYLVQIWLNVRENRKTGMVVRYGWKLWIAAYGFFIALLFTSTTALAHPMHQKLLLLDHLATAGSKITPLHSLLLPALLSLLNPLIQAICLEKYRGDCVDLLNLCKGNPPNIT